MKKRLKEIIETAKTREDFGWYDYKWFLIIPTNEPYRGMFGKNGYNNMIILGYDDDEKAYYRLNGHDTDDFSISGLRFVQFDVPEEYGCIRIHYDGKLRVGGLPLSSVMAEKEGTIWQ